MVGNDDGAILVNVNIESTHQGIMSEYKLYKHKVIII